MAASIKTRCFSKMLFQRLLLSNHRNNVFILKHLCTTKDYVATHTNSNTSQSSENEKSEDRIQSDTSLHEIGTHDQSISDTIPTQESSFVRTFQKLESVKYDEENVDNFVAMLRKSKLMQIGNIQQKAIGRTVLGKIFEVVNDDLYIDFGGKFHCVCKRPQKFPELYNIGTTVKISLRDMEMTSKFLGSEKHVTLLEADATLIGLHNPPRRPMKAIDNKK